MIWIIIISHKKSFKLSMQRVRKLHLLRRLSQISFLLFFLTMPIFNILRYDSDTKEFYLLGKVWSLGIRDALIEGTLSGSGEVAGIIVLKAILPWLVVLAFFPVMGAIFGRFFCGWLCPEGFLFEFADYLNEKILGRRSLFKKKNLNGNYSRNGRRLIYIFLALFFYLTVPPIIGALLSGFFIAPSRIWNEITMRNLSTGLMAGMIGVTIYIVITSILVRHTFCKYVCAPGLMQTLFGWFSPRSLRVVFDRENISRCTDCRRCERVCFMDVRPRSPKKEINCVNCGECITACREELGIERGLFRFRFGEGNTSVKKLHKNQPIDAFQYRY